MPTKVVSSEHIEQNLPEAGSCHRKNSRPWSTLFEECGSASKEFVVFADAQDAASHGGILRIALQDFASFLRASRSNRAFHGKQRTQFELNETVLTVVKSMITKSALKANHADRFNISESKDAQLSTIEAQNEKIIYLEVVFINLVVDLFLITA